MKITSQDEYGLRILIRLAKCEEDEGMSIPQLSEAEGISGPYVSKLTRSLRLAGLIQSTRGHKGGYLLSRPAEEITVSDVMRALGGRLYDSAFCENHSGALNLCTNSIDCSIRSLWSMVQESIDVILDKVTLQDLAGSEKMVSSKFEPVVQENKQMMVDMIERLSEQVHS